MNKHLISALKKVHRHYKDKWVGYLRPDEIIALLEDGARCEEFQRENMEFAKKRKATGKCNPVWFYFKLGKHSPMHLKKEI
jgi:hypothetical protein